jgi:hypothetical protein
VSRAMGFWLFIAALLAMIAIVGLSEKAYEIVAVFGGLALGIVGWFAFQHIREWRRQRKEEDDAAEEGAEA